MAKKIYTDVRIEKIKKPIHGLGEAEACSQKQNVEALLTKGLIL